MYRDFSLCREISLLYKQGYHCTDRWGRAHLTCGFSHCTVAFFNNVTFFSELASLKSMTFLQKHLNIFNITYTVNCFLLGLYTDTDLSPMALLCSTYHHESFTKIIHFTMFPIQTKPGPYWTLGCAPTGEEALFFHSGLSREKEDETISQIQKASINYFVIWKYVK